MRHVPKSNVLSRMYILSAVYVSFNLLSINELNEVTETLKSTGYLRIDWRDDFLTWNTSDFGGLTYAFFPQDDVWKPDVALKNSMVDYKQLGVASLNVQVTADGEVLWYPFQVIIETGCLNLSVLELILPLHLSRDM